MAKASTLVDEFDTLDTSKWTFSAGVTAVDSELRMPADTVNWTKHTANSVARFDATEDTIVWHMPEVVQGGWSTLTGLYFQPVNAGDKLTLYVEGTTTGPGLLRIRKTVNYANTDVSTGHNLSWTWLRYRHTAGNVFLDTSSDGITWTQRLTTTEISGLSNVVCGMTAGGGNASQVPTGTGRFAALNPAPVNAPPTASAGPDQAVMTGDTVTLTGAGMDSDGTIASYSWTLSSKPAGSTAVLSGSGATRSFTADIAGSYTATLTTTDDDGAISTADTIVVTATAPVLTGPHVRVNGSYIQSADCVVRLNGSYPEVYLGGTGFGNNFGNDFGGPAGGA